MFTYVHYENEKQIGKVRDRDIFVNRRIDRHSQMNSKKGRPLLPHPPPPPPGIPSVATQPRRHLFHTHIHAQEYSHQTSTKSTDAIDNIRLQSQLSTDILKQYEEPMPSYRCSTPNLHTCNDCSHYKSHCICAVSSNELKDYANWKHNFHTSPLVFRPVENIPEELSGNSTSRTKIHLPCVPPKTPTRTSSLRLKSSAMDRISKIYRKDSISANNTVEIHAKEMINDSKQSQQQFESELMKIQMEFAYMKELAVNPYGTREIEYIIKKSNWAADAYPTALPFIR